MTTYKKQIIVIFGSYISQVADSIEEPIVRSKMKDMVVNDTWVSTLYGRMIKRKINPAQAAIEEATWVLAYQSKEITASECVRIKKKYLRLMQ